MYKYYSDKASPYVGDDGYEYSTTTGKTFRISDNNTPIISQTYHSPIKPYNIETFNLQKGDVILLHLHEDIDVEGTQQILEDMKKIFPDNTVIVANEHILRGLTILRLPTEPEVGEVNMFDKEIGAPDFLNHWLKRDMEI